MDGVPCDPRQQVPPTCQAQSTPQGPTAEASAWDPSHPSASLCANPSPAILGWQSGGGLGWALGIGRCDGMEWSRGLSGESISFSPRVSLGLLILTHFMYNSLEPSTCWVSPVQGITQYVFAPFFGRLTWGFFSSKLSSVSIEKLNQDTFQGPFSISLVAQTVKRLPTMRETGLQSLGQEDLPEKEMAIHSSTLAWKIPWMEEPGGL